MSNNKKQKTMSTEEKNQGQQREVDAFAIFGMKVEDIVSYDEKEKTDWSKIFYEPNPEENKPTLALIKFLPNIYDLSNPILQNFSYKLPHPDNPKHKFRFVSPTTVGKPCPVVSAWYEMKESDDARLNEIAKSLKRKRSRCAIIQIIKDTQNPELNGQLRLFRFQYDGDIDKLIIKKLKPSKEEVETLGVKPENIFDPFNSPIMILRSTKGDYGRDFAGSEWAKDDKNMGMMIPNDDGTMRVLSAKDAGNLDIQKKIIEMLKADNVNINEYYAYKEPSAEMLALVKKSLEMLSNGQLSINTSDDDEDHEETNATDVPITTDTKKKEPTIQETKKEKPKGSSAADDILNEINLRKE